MLLFFGLNFHTRNGKIIEVPDITKKSIAEAINIKSKKLRYNVVDSTRFDPALFFITQNLRLEMK